VWSAQGWAKRLGLPSEVMDHGYGHTSTQVAAVAAACAASGQLGEYHEATYTQTVELVSAISDADLDRVVDTRWTPPVTLGVRLVSVLDDDMQHVGQAAYVRGIVLRKG
jgi:hypothetical protein